MGILGNTQNECKWKLGGGAKILVMGIGLSRTQQEADKYDAEDLHVYI